MHRGIIWGGVLSAALMAWPAHSSTEIARYRLLSIDGQQVRWPKAEGETLVLTYAFVRRRTPVPGARNCGLLDPLAHLSRRSGIPLSVAKREIVAGIRQWSKVADIAFKPASNWRRADILIGAKAPGGGTAYADVFPRPAQGEVSYIGRSLICFDAGQAWKTAPDGNLKRYSLRYVATHEAGHAIGLDHPGSDHELMSFRYLERFSAPQPGDVRGVVHLYGPPGKGTLPKAGTTMARQLDGSAPLRAQSRSLTGAARVGRALPPAPEPRLVGSESSRSSSRSLGARSRTGE